MGKGAHGDDHQPLLVDKKGPLVDEWEWRQIHNECCFVETMGRDQIERIEWL